MNLETKVSEINALVQKGAIVDAVKEFFADTAVTSDFSGVKTASKSQMIEKMEGFAAAIVNVNGISHIKTLINGHTSNSEFIFDFDMTDGSKIYWHEIIKRDWNDAGEVVKEEYFKA